METVETVETVEAVDAGARGGCGSAGPRERTDEGRRVERTPLPEDARRARR